MDQIAKFGFIQTFAVFKNEIEKISRLLFLLFKFEMGDH